MHTLWQDLRHGLRMLAKSPGFTTIAVLTLALGIGANTAIFSTVNALLLRPYPFPNLDQLVLAGEAPRGQKIGQSEVAPADFLDWKNESHAFSALVAYRFGDFNLTGNGEIDSVVGYAVSPDFFDVVGVQPAFGRSFSREEGEPGQDHVVILSHRYWQRQFGGDPNLLGKTLQINGRSYSVVGIMPTWYQYPLAGDVWMPLAFAAEEKTDRTKLSLYVLARMKQDVSLGQARADLQDITQNLAQRYPKTNANREVSLLWLREEQYAYTAPLFLMLQVAAGFVLLLACANLANLLFARMIARQKEIAVRTALGASRSRLARLFVSEAVVLSLLAAAVAIAVSYWGVTVIRNGMPPGMTQWIAGWKDIRVDKNVLGFTLFLSVLVGIAFGLAALFQSAHIDVNQMLKEGSGTSTEFGKHRLRSALAVVQISLAMVLLAGAGLLIKGFLRVADVYRIFEPEKVLRAEISLPEQRYSDRTRVVAFYDQILRGASTLPGVQSAAIVDNLPASNVDSRRTNFTIQGRPALQVSETPEADLQTSSSEIFSLLKIPVLNGRALSELDGADAPRVAVISRAMAQGYWPGASPIGQNMKLGGTDSEAPWLRIVGVVGDIKLNWFDPQPRPVIYLPYQQEPLRGMSLAVRTSVNPESITPAVRQVVSRIDPDIALSGIHSLQLEVDDSLAPIRIIGALMLVFGAVALTLSAIGVYGLLAHAVAQRSHEFGIRMALGAQPRDLLRLVIGKALQLSGTGLAIAVPLSVALNWIMRSQLFGLVALSGFLLAGIAILLALVALAAGYLPARRAMRVDPMVALRYE